MNAIDKAMEGPPYSTENQAKLTTAHLAHLNGVHKARMCQKQLPRIPGVLTCCDMAPKLKTSSLLPPNPPFSLVWTHKGAALTQDVPLPKVFPKAAKPLDKENQLNLFP